MLADLLKFGFNFDNRYIPTVKMRSFRQYIIMNWSVLWKDLIAVYKVKVTTKVTLLYECSSEWLFLNSWTCYEVWYCVPFFVTKLDIVMHHHWPGCYKKKDWFAVIKVIVGVSKKWLFLPYLLNFRSFYNQIWLEGTLSEAYFAAKSDKLGG